MWSQTAKTSWTAVNDQELKTSWTAVNDQELKTSWTAVNDQELKANHLIRTRFVEASLQTMAALGARGARNLLNPSRFRCPIKHCSLLNRGLVALHTHSDFRYLKQHFVNHESLDKDEDLCKILRERIFKWCSKKSVQDF